MPVGNPQCIALEPDLTLSEESFGFGGLRHGTSRSPFGSVVLQRRVEMVSVLDTLDAEPGPCQPRGPGPRARI